MMAFEKEYLQRKTVAFDLQIVVLMFSSVLMCKGIKH